MESNFNLPRAFTVGGETQFAAALQPRSWGLECAVRGGGGVGGLASWQPGVVLGAAASGARHGRAAGGPRGGLAGVPGGVRRGLPGGTACLGAGAVEADDVGLGRLAGRKFGGRAAETPFPCFLWDNGPIGQQQENP